MEYTEVTMDTKRSHRHGRLKIETSLDTDTTATDELPEHERPVPKFLLYRPASV
jgi:hypothetical protein